jgi:hypothetical protein
MIAEPTTIEIYQRADAGIAELEEKHAGVAQRLSQTQGELAALVQARKDRLHVLETLRSLTAKSEACHVQAQQYLKLVTKTPREEQAIHDLTDAKKHAAERRKELTALEAEVETAERRDKPREDELTTSLQELSTEQEFIEQEIGGLARAKQQAFDEEGRERHAKAEANYQEKQRAVDELESQLTTAKIALLECHLEGLGSLENWPVLRKSIADLRPPDDATIRALRMSIDYLSLLEADAEKIQSPYLPSLNRGMNADSLFELLSYGKEIKELHHGHVQLPHAHQPGVETARLQGIKSTFASRRWHLEQVLNEYIAHKQRG